MPKKAKGKVDPAKRRGNRLIEYIRVSKVNGRDKDAEGNESKDFLSPDMQHRENERAAEREGCVIVKSITELDKSGTSSSTRRIREIIGMIERGEADGVIVWKISRWGRNLLDSLYNINELQAHGGFIVSATEPLGVDSGTAMGRLPLIMLLTFAEMVAEDLGKTWKNVHDLRRDNGRTHGGGPRLGYLQTKHLTKKQREELGPIPLVESDGREVDHIPDPQTAPWITKCYEWYSQGVTWGEMCRRLEQAGLRSSRDGVIKIPALRVSMDSGFPAGKVIDKRGDDVVYREGNHAPIIGEETWERYLRKRQDKATPPRSKSPAFRLAGLLRCGSCGANMATQWKTPKNQNFTPHRQFRCARHGSMWPVSCTEQAFITEPPAERMVLEWLKAQAWGQDALDAAIARAHRVEEAKADVKRLEREIAGALKRMSILTDLMIDGKISNDSFEQKEAEIKETLRRLQIAKVDTKIDVEVNDIPSPDLFGALVDGWERLDPEVLNSGLRKVIKFIEVVRPEERHGRASLRIVGGWEKDPRAAEEDVA